MRNEMTFNVGLDTGVDITYRELQSGNKYARVAVHTRTADNPNKEIFDALMRSGVGRVQHYIDGKSREFSTVSIDLGRLEITLFGAYMADEVPEREQGVKDEADVGAAS